MAFHDLRFPTSLSLGAMGGPERRTEIVTLASGHEERNSLWAHARRRYDAGLGLRSLDDVALLLAFFEARAGRLHAFRWKDWADFKSCLPSATPAATDQFLGWGDEVRAVFALQKTYASGEASYARPITRPVAGTVTVSLGGDPQTEGLHYTLDLSGGTITFADPPDNGAEVRAGFAFDVPVRFDTDLIQTSVASFHAGEIPHVPVLEVRE